MRSRAAPPCFSPSVRPAPDNDTHVWEGGGKKPKSTRTHSKQMFKFSHGIDCKTAYHLWCRRVALTDISRRCHDNHRRMNHLSPSPYMRDVYQAFLLSVFNRFLSVCKKKKCPSDIYSFYESANSHDPLNIDRVLFGAVWRR